MQVRSNRIIGQVRTGVYGYTRKADVLEELRAKNHRLQAYVAKLLEDRLHEPCVHCGRARIEAQQ